MNDIILTIDAGTTGLKCTAFDVSGNARARALVPYPTKYPKPGWAQQSADDFLSAAIKGVKLALSQGILKEHIRAIGLCGHMNGCLPVVDYGNALYDNIIHSDSRSAKECAKMALAIDPQEYYRLTGNRQDPHFTLSKALWLQSEVPEVFSKTRFILNTKDFLFGALTGQWGITDFSDASLTAALDIHKRVWAGDMLRELGIDTRIFPEIRLSTEVSPLLPDIAGEMGLLPGTPVAIGAGDGSCAARGAGVYASGQAYGYVGSSAWISVMSDEAVIDAQARAFNYLDIDGRHCHFTGTVQCAAAAFDWALEKLLGLGSAYDFAEALARKAPIGSGGVLFLPTLMGERTPYWDERTRGVLVGMSLYHDRSHLIRAVYEGVAFALRNVVEVFADNGISIDTLMLTGGGAKSGLWPEMMASIHNVPLSVHKHPGEATSLGAAIAAGVGVGLFSSFEDASKMVEAARSLVPDAGEHEAYMRSYRLYSKIYGLMKPLFDEISVE